MRRVLWLAASGGDFCDPDAPVMVPATGSDAAASAASSGAIAPPRKLQRPQDSLAAAARRAREQKKDAPKPAKVFD